MRPKRPADWETGDRQPLPDREPEASLAWLYDCHGLDVYRLALKILSNPHEAEDLTQEVFLTFWQRAAFKPERGGAKQYLLTLTYSRAVDRLRRRGIHWRVLQRLSRQVLLATDSTEPLERMATEERIRALRQAMAQLSPVQCECLKLAYFEGLTQVQIAHRLAIPLGTVKTRCRDALIKLKNLLGPH